MVEEEKILVVSPTSFTF